MRHYNNNLLIRHLKIWLMYYKNNLKIKSQITVILKRWTFRHWRSYVFYNAKKKEKTLEAWRIYDMNITKGALKIILRAGLAQQREKEVASFEESTRRLKIAIKYFKIWRNKIITQTCNSTQMEFSENFQWNPICFQSAKIPYYLHDKYNI